MDSSPPLSLFPTFTFCFEETVLFATSDPSFLSTLSDGPVNSLEVGDRIHYRELEFLVVSFGSETPLLSNDVRSIEGKKLDSTWNIRVNIKPL